MPTQRFIRLCEEKQKLISEAVMDEFLRTQYGELRISRIARDAHVSRGSLYTYFCDKEDMFLYALSLTWTSVLEHNKRILLECGGDFWAMMGLALEYHVKICRSNQICRLLYLASDQAAASWKEAFVQKKEEEYKRYKEWIYIHMDKSDLIDCTWESTYKLEDACHALLMASVQKYLCGGDENTIENDFSMKLLQIRKGVCLFE